MTVQSKRRKQILDGLHRCLLRASFQETSIKDIAAEAGLNHGVLHYYFRSKDDILLSFIDYVIETYQQRFARWEHDAHARGLTGRKLIREMLDFMNRELAMDRQLARIFVEIRATANHHPGVRKRLRAAYRIWTGVVEVALSHAGVPRAEAERRAAALVALSEGMSVFAIIAGRKKGELLQALTESQDRLLDDLSD